MGELKYILDHQCRGLAAVLFGNPNSTKSIPLAPTARFQQLQGRTVDLLIGGETHNVAREVSELFTKTGFTFSSAYNYDGMAYYGNATFVSCAEEERRYKECTSLQICVLATTSHYITLIARFPTDFVTTGPTVAELTTMLLNGTCNVIAYEKSYQWDLQQSDEIIGQGYVIGEKMVSKEPLAIVTRNNDVEFSDIVNWMVQALFYGEEQGLMKDPSRCRRYTNLTGRVADLDFMNAVYCVGNYGELAPASSKNLDTNHINNGTTGMIYAIPFGTLANEANAASKMLSGIRNEGSLNCGVVVPDEITEGNTTSNNMVGMNIDYCLTVAAAILNGDYTAVNLRNFSENDDSSYLALDNGTIDVLSGAKIERKYDFSSSPALGGFQFSTPYFYGNETVGNAVSFFSLATREDDMLFSSFVNTIVVATIYAHEKKIERVDNKDMPLMALFGSDFSWALRDAISFSGGYDELYTKNFGDVSEEDRGRNTLNKGGPQIYSYPGLSP